LQHVYDSLTVSHILIIGTVDKPNAPFVFSGITKTFLIIKSDELGNTPKYKNVTIEEYLNLYYIEHFSLNIIEFSELYNKYKNNTGEEPGGVAAPGGVVAPGGVGRQGGGEEGQGVAPGWRGGQGGGGGTEMTGKKNS